MPPDEPVSYTDEQGVLRTVLAACAARGWVVLNLSVNDDSRREGVANLLDERPETSRLATVTLTLSGPDVSAAPALLASHGGVVTVERDDEETE